MTDVKWTHVTLTDGRTFLELMQCVDPLMKLFLTNQQNSMLLKTAQRQVINVFFSMLQYSENAINRMLIL